MLKMKLILLFFCFSPLALAEAIWGPTLEFGDWEAVVITDDFENEKRPIMTGNVFEEDGSEKLGRFTISRFKQLSTGIHAEVSIYISFFSGAWPECDYEQTKYKIDEGKSLQFPKIGHTCETLILNPQLIKEMKKGNVLKIKVKNQVGIISLKGFTKAWEYSAREFLSAN